LREGGAQFSISMVFFFGRKMELKKFVALVFREREREGREMPTQSRQKMDLNLKRFEKCTVKESFV
jgi:hypothetical protein